MKVISVQPVEITAVFEMTVSELAMIKRVLDRTEINFNSEDEQSVMDATFVTDHFYKVLAQILEQYGES